MPLSSYFVPAPLPVPALFGRGSLFSERETGVCVSDIATIGSLLIGISILSFGALPTFMPRFPWFFGLFIA